MIDINTSSPEQYYSRGFTLVELAIVLAIVALLLGGLLPVMSAQVEQQQRNETRKQLNEIKEALIGFAIINGRLPCPANGANASGDESTSGAGAALVCNLTKGVLPWSTLGVRETDAWNQRFTYRVTANFADGADGTGAACTNTAGVSFQLCSTANLNVLTAVAGTSVASGMPAVIVSHGPNGLGAYPAGGGTQVGTPLADELENSDDDNSFVSHDPVQNGFDDIVVWISPNTLINRMVSVAKLP